MEPHPSASLGSAAWKAAVLDGLLMRHIGVDDGPRTHKKPLRWQRNALPIELHPHMVLPTRFEPARIDMKSLCLNHLTTTA